MDNNIIGLENLFPPEVIEHAIRQTRGRPLIHSDTVSSISKDTYCFSPETLSPDASQFPSPIVSASYASTQPSER